MIKFIKRHLSVLHKLTSLIMLAAIGACLIYSESSAKTQPTAYSDTVFEYSGTIPKIECSVLEISDIELSPDESIIDVFVGDATRWNIELSKSGSRGLGLAGHVIVKPLDDDLKTSLVITTSQRTYHLELKTSRQGYMPHVLFRYSDAENSLLNNEAPEDTTALSNEEELKKQEALTKDDYLISGDPEIMPECVFNDGHRTFIVMPDDIDSKTLPVLTFPKDSGSLFSGETSEFLNYRIANHAFIVDGLFSRARLSIDNQEVEIEYYRVEG